MMCVQDLSVSVANRHVYTGDNGFAPAPGIISEINFSGRQVSSTEGRETVVCGITGIDRNL